MFYVGVIENRTDDPLKLGRCRVRIIGIHTEDKSLLPTEDLPWAVLMQPTTSAAMSGIGQSPTGLVEGTSVIVIFRDEYQQHPIIIGTLAGIPEKPVDKAAAPAPQSAESNVLTTSDGSTVTDSSGNAIQTGTPVDTTTPPPVEEKQPEIKKPTSALVASEAAYASIRAEEGLCSITQGKYKIGKDSYSGTVYAYQDTKQIWTIGWGSTYLADNTRVDANTTLSKSDCDALLKSKVDKEFAAGIRRNLKVPVTQSMFDALVSIAYNAGVVGVTGSAMFSALNSGNYEQAASLIPSCRNKGNLTARRNREKDLFMKEGFPKKDMSGVTPPPKTAEAEAVARDATQNPVVKLKPSTDTATVAGSGSTGQNDVSADEGFRDPNNVYPKYFAEPDTHRLARHEKIDQTIVYAKEAARVKNITAGGSSTWTQPPVPYNAKYPFNHVHISESGHVQEVDDTEGNERIHTYHRSGTYEEVDTNGTRVCRIVGDDFMILERNGHVLIKGTCNVTIIGNQNIRVENDANIDVLGDVNMTVGGDINMGATGNINMQAGGDIGMRAGGNVAADGSNVYWNSGKAGSAALGKGSAVGVPDMPTLTTPNRFQSMDANYETPEEGDPAEFNAKKDAVGATDPEDADKQDTTAVATETPPEKEPDPVTKDCTGVDNKEQFGPSFVLTSNFKLGDMKAIPSGINFGLKASEIVCNLKQLAENCLDPIKRKYPNMNITNAWRSEADNTRVGGVKTSDHLTGSACDFQLPGFTRQQYYDAIIDLSTSLPAYTQLILEYKSNGTTWIHVSYAPKKGLKMEKFTMLDNAKRISDMGTYKLLS